MKRILITFTIILVTFCSASNLNEEFNLRQILLDIHANDVDNPSQYHCPCEKGAYILRTNGAIVCTFCQNEKND
jgi:hypothetical protein